MIRAVRKLQINDHRKDCDFVHKILCHLCDFMTQPWFSAVYGS